MKQHSLAKTRYCSLLACSHASAMVEYSVILGIIGILICRWRSCRSHRDA